MKKIVLIIVMLFSFIFNNIVLADGLSQNQKFYWENSTGSIVVDGILPEIPQLYILRIEPDIELLNQVQEQLLNNYLKRKPFSDSLNYRYDEKIFSYTNPYMDMTFNIESGGIIFKLNAKKIYNKENETYIYNISEQEEDKYTQLAVDFIEEYFGGLQSETFLSQIQGVKIVFKRMYKSVLLDGPEIQLELFDDQIVWGVRVLYKIFEQQVVMEQDVLSLYQALEKCVYKIEQEYRYDSYFTGIALIYCFINENLVIPTWFMENQFGDEIYINAINGHYFDSFDYVPTEDGVYFKLKGE